MRVVLPVILSFILVDGLQAQTAADTSWYNPGIVLMDNAKTLDEYLGVVHYFEGIAQRFPSHWLARYYAGLGYLHASYLKEGNKAKDDLIDKAQQQIDGAMRAKPGNAEVHVLQAFLYQSRLQVNPEIRGLTYSQKAEGSIKKAIAADPSNPRAYFLLACNIYYTPVLFGGGAKNALPVFLDAAKKYNAFKPELPFSPDWGEMENRQMIRTCEQSGH